MNLRQLARTLVLAALVPAAVLSTTFCTHRPEVVPGIPVNQLPGHDQVGIDTSPKEELRLVPAEAYMRTYLQLFGGLAPGAPLSPIDLQKKARAGDGGQLFDTWDDYVAALGLPDYRNDIPRGAQTNALMVATFERLGVALCDRAVEHDFGTGGAKGKPAAPANERAIFAFEPTKNAPTALEFAARFDVLHRTFLGYPAALAETDRTARFFELYNETVKRHEDAKSAKSRFSPMEIGWANVCYGLIRHPEFQLY